MSALLRLLCLLAGLSALSPAYASCIPPSPPVGSGGAWFSAYQSWCRACGGTPSANASPARCDPGPNWGGRASSGTAPAYSPGAALGQQIGAVGADLLRCALFNQCPGGAGLSEAGSDQARQRNQEMNEQQKALIARAEREEAATLAASQQRVQAALGGAGGLQARDLSADPTPAKVPAARQINLAAYLSQQAWKAESPQRTAELSNLAFDAALGGIVDSDASEQALAAPVDERREQEFQVLHQRYFESRGRVIAKTEMWVELVDHKAQVVALREEARRRMNQASDQTRLRAADAQAAQAEAELEAKIAQARQDARQSQQPASEDGRKLRDFLDPDRHDRSAFLKGYVDASQCFQPAPAVRCSGLKGGSLSRCLQDYESGYRVGEQQKQQMLLQAALIGYGDRSQGHRPSAFTHPGASGPCRMAWMAAYTDGYNSRSSPIAPR